MSGEGDGKPVRRMTTGQGQQVDSGAQGGAVRRSTTAGGQGAATQGPAAAARVERPVQGGEPATIFAGITADFEPRDGDVLVVSYPEVTLPLPKQYSGIKVGGNIYTRKLKAGDDAMEQFERIHNWLKSVTEKQAVERFKLWATEVERKTA